ncbi:4-amino-5-hydroxymethyl-2-methylpyrimidine phosphate synthase [Venturia nashicola]|uniref:4-amino-5-hydroxymethyl-2-methylpyrimidine phosphate synthase n=1 Tax=Venturia nashicola TaxID=86259 RepID=A0A4Z1P031_9PEZI|nr:4-amino-5-hydroxymethyl-2-methylpyrimidine phosphate synthase [Venturia nashicola]TLD20227.1 4-amino-5-hydroxymethyl-2-methylpyrimidine phosphate synthase [Venturia nashicola]
MPPSIPSPNLHVRPISLTERSFLQFGTLIQNPAHNPSSPTTNRVVSANQGSALKYIDIAHITNYYPQSPSKKDAKPVMNMFVSSPRKLRQQNGGEMVFDVKIMERHPYTPQTFIPLGLSKNSKTKYLVIVAPTLPAGASGDSNSESPNLSSFTNSSPSLAKTQNTIQQNPPSSKPQNLSSYTNSSPNLAKSQSQIAQNQETSLPDFSPSSLWPRGPGLPDLTRVTAFIADGSQAVTYGAGTWHAPIVVLGEGDVDFVVVQWANGVPSDDCQEIILEGGEVTVGVGEMKMRARL